MPTILTEPREMPRYQQMARDIEEQIGSGALPPGSRLPSFGHMRSEYGASPATMERVYAALEKKGLIRREAKRGIFVAEPTIRPAPSAIAVVWNYDDSRDSYYAQILRGIQNGAHRHGLQVLLIPDPSSISGATVAGLILNGYNGDHGKSNYKEEYLKQVPEGLPTVCILCHDEKLPEVVANDRQGIIDAMEHLFGNGHRRIGYLTAGCQGNADDLSIERLAAYHEGLDRFGIAGEPQWVRPFCATEEVLGSKTFRDQGRQSMTEWLEDAWDTLGCTALLAQNDDTAIGVIEALQAAGYRVPEDVSVIGFDGTKGAEYFSPRLTTIEVPLQSIGAGCVDMLVDVMGQPFPGSKTQIVMPTALRIGESSGPIGGREQGAYFKSTQLGALQGAELVTA